MRGGDSVTGCALDVDIRARGPAARQGMALRHSVRGVRVVAMTKVDGERVDETTPVIIEPMTRRSRLESERRRVSRRLKRRDAALVAVLATVALATGVWAAIPSNAPGPNSDSVDVIADAAPVGWRGSSRVGWRGSSRGTRLLYSPDRSGVVTGVAFPSSGSSASSYAVGIWSGRSRIANATTASDESGWLEASFAAPVAVSAGKTYAILYWASPRSSSAAPADAVAVRFRTADEDALPQDDLTTRPTGLPSSGSTAGSPTTPDGASASGSEQPPNGEQSSGTTTTQSPPSTGESTAPTTNTSTTSTTVPVTAPTTSSPATSGATGCAAVPSRCGYPDATNTGIRPGVTLRKVPGDLTQGSGWRWNSSGYLAVTGDGAVLDGLEIDGTLDISADNVVVQNVRVIEQGESFGIAVRHADNVTIQDSEVFSPYSDSRRLMVGIKDIYGDSAGLRVLRSDIWHTATGIQVEAGVLQDNYIHDIAYKAGDHLNGTTSNGGGSSPLTIRHNTVFNHHDQTDAISLFQDFGLQRNRVIDDNLMAGGGYSLYGGATPGKSVTSNIKITNNRFARLYHAKGGYYGPVTAVDKGSGNVWSGNVWDDTGQLVAP